MYTDKNPITATPVDYHVEAVAADPDSVRGAEPVQAAPQIISRDLSHINAGGAKEFLQQKGWPEGLQNAFVDNLAKVPIRFFICDDSGSMMTNDGHKLVDGKNGKKVMVDCSRWAELSQALSFHAELARQANAPTEFRLLNGAPPIMVGTADDVDGSHFASLMAILDNSPGGGTPLCRHIREVTAVIQSLAESLRAKSQRACVMIASDGAASDGDVATALRPLKDLPAWVVIRLCTDDDSVVDYWNNVDSQLELEMDVLDDLSGEATEVETANKWLTYAEPLHRLREFGIPVKEFDLLDESLLSMEQFWKTCSLILGGKLKDLPHPAVDWNQFLIEVDRLNKKAPKVWSVTTKKEVEWINLRAASKVYQKRGCSIM